MGGVVFITFNVLTVCFLAAAARERRRRNQIEDQIEALRDRRLELDLEDIRNDLRNRYP